MELLEGQNDPSGIVYSPYQFPAPIDRRLREACRRRITCDPKARGD